MESQNSLSIHEVKRRVVSSFLSLTARQIALRAISFITLNIILAKVLPIQTLGIFNIATAIITFFAFFSDIGLAASLIQKKEAVTKIEIKTVFTIQQILVFLISMSVIIGAPIIGGFYSLDESGIWLIRILGFAFFLTSLKVVPSVLCERELKFHPLVITEITETIIFNGLLIWGVFAGLGIWSFTIAALARGIVGTSVLYLLAPAPVGFMIDRLAMKQLLSFGLPYQTNSLLALIKDRLVPLVIARMVGEVGIGYITWSQNMAFLPLEIMNIVLRITFPAFSRMQHDNEVLTRAVEKSLFATSLMVYPALFGMCAIIPSMITYIVSPKWQPALLSFYCFAFSAYWAVISTTFTNVLNAVGKIKITLKLMVFWTILTWVLTPILVYFYGFLGVGYASLIISFSSILTIILVKKILPVKVLDSIFFPTLSSLIMGILVYLSALYFVRDRLTLFATIFLGGFIYLLIIKIFNKDEIIWQVLKKRNE